MLALSYVRFDWQRLKRWCVDVPTLLKLGIYSGTALLAATVLSWVLLGIVLAVAFVFSFKDTNLLGAFFSFIGMAIAFGIAFTVFKDLDG